ncbi:GDSL lipase/esterase [Dillenia turbinata]|uniref:GDSL lipase/esterase n=1 Tax=Dillenia turbinata TaxID=194707 RepID=A0AAN8YXQ3_9MAGN
MGTGNSISLLHFFTFAHLVSLNLGAPALYALGDSIFDAGNNNFLPTLAKANYLPYGSDFESGATGRFTNNKTIADCIAGFLGLPHLPPSLSLRGTITKTGSELCVWIMWNSS